MKKILIVFQGYTYGGTTSSLLALLNHIDIKKIKADLFCRSHAGPLKEQFMPFNILKENVWLSHNIIEGGLLMRVTNILLQTVRKLCKHIFHLDLYPLYGRIGGRQIRSYEYDAVISFQESLSQVVCGYPSKNRIAWVRCEYMRYLSLTNKDETKIYDAFHKVVCVSKFAKESFCVAYPQMRDKTFVIQNVIDTDGIKRKSLLTDGLKPEFDTSKFTIVSIGRVDAVKQFEKIPQVAAAIKRHTSQPFRWYIIGEGDGKLIELIRNNIVANGVESNVVLLGAISNVYPYMIQSDIVVHTSKSESFSRVVNDAKCLGVPVIVNNYGCATEFLSDGEEGYVIPIDEMGERISYLMVHSSELAQIRDYLKSFTYNNSRILQQIEEIV